MTPQEKKIRNYVHGRRNSYGENDKASRKAIRRRKAWVNRSNRRNQNRIISQFRNSPFELDDSIASAKRKKWQKAADMPLGTMTSKKLKRRVNLAINNTFKKSKLRSEALRRIKQRYGSLFSH